MRHLAIFGLVPLVGLLSACQSRQQPPEEGAYVDFVLEMMVESAEQSKGPDNADRAIKAVEDWRGAGEEGTD